MKQLFVIDPIEQINPKKDSSAALMQAAERASIEAWICTPSDLQVANNKPSALANRINPDPWFTLEKKQAINLNYFNYIWMRKDPPVDESYLYSTHILEIAEREGVNVINRPSSLRAWNEKLGSLRFINLMAPTMVGSNVKALTEFASEFKEIVLKPLGGKGGQGIIRAKSNSPGLEALIELITNQQTIPILIQKFLPEVMEGDKRILLVNGEPLGAINRKPKQGEFRSNLALGGEPHASTLTLHEKKICKTIAPILINEGLFFVGIDVIGGMLSEINVTSPTGIREVEELQKIPLADLIIDRLTTSSF